MASYQTPSLLWDAGLASLLYRGLETDSRFRGMTSFVVWLLFTKIVKLLPYFSRYLVDMIYIPASILFWYAHGFLNVYAYFTLGEVYFILRSINLFL